MLLEEFEEDTTWALHFSSPVDGISRQRHDINHDAIHVVRYYFEADEDRDSI